MFDKIRYSLLLLMLSASASAATYSYVDWTAMDTAAGTASGTITLNDGQVITVQLSSTQALGPQSQMGNVGDLDYWTGYATTYTSQVVENIPTNTDFISPNETVNSAITITFSQPVTQLAMDLVSLGQAGIPVTYSFDSAFILDQQGTGYWGTGSLTSLSSTTLQGAEGHGLIRFPAAITSLTINITPEGYNGFTIGAPNPPAVVPANTPMGLLFMTLLFAGFGLYYRRKLST